MLHQGKGICVVLNGFHRYLLALGGFDQVTFVLLSTKFLFNKFFGTNLYLIVTLFKFCYFIAYLGYQYYIVLFIFLFLSFLLFTQPSSFQNTLDLVLGMNQQLDFFGGLYSFDNAQKMKFSINDFFSKFDQIRCFLPIWQYLLEKSFMKNFICYFSVSLFWAKIKAPSQRTFES